MMAERNRNLRKIKKELTEKILAEKAYELAIEKGMDGFIIEDVVQRSGYSRRTFANYYSCKEEAVAKAVITSCKYDRLMDEIKGLPLKASPLEVMYHIAKILITEDLILKIYQFVILSRRYSALQPYVLKVIYEAQVNTEHILNDLFHDRYSTVYIQLLAGVIFAAIIPLFSDKKNLLLPGQDPNGYLNAVLIWKYIDDIFDYLKTGF